MHRAINKHGHLDFETSVAIGDGDLDPAENGLWTYDLVCKRKLRVRYYPEWWATHAACETSSIVPETFVHPREESVQVDRRISRLINGTRVSFIRLYDASGVRAEARAAGLPPPPDRWLVTKNPTKKVRPPSPSPSISPSASYLRTRALTLSPHSSSTTVHVARRARRQG